MWYIMSYNQIRGFLSGTFQNIDALFYAGAIEGPLEGGSRKWVALLSEAQGFETFDAAKEFVDDVWGAWFSRSKFSIVYHREQMKASDEHEIHARKQCDRRQALSKRLRMKLIDAEELTRMADDPESYDLTWRERWIIDTMNRDHPLDST